MFAAQAFHWFDKPVALPEIARVLRPGGVFAIVWNQGDDDRPDPRPSDFVHEVQLLHDAALRRWENGPDWEELLRGSRLFGDCTTEHPSPTTTCSTAQGSSTTFARSAGSRAATMARPLSRDSERCLPDATYVIPNRANVIWARKR